MPGRMRYVGVAGGDLAALAGLTGSAAAQDQDGLVNVMIGDVAILEDVAAVVSRSSPVAVLGPVVDRSGASRLP